MVRLRRNVNELFKPGIANQSIAWFRRRIKRWWEASHYLKNLPIMPLARLPAMPPDKALLANVEAWLKRSQREKATVLVTVKIRAIAMANVSGWSIY